MGLGRREARQFGQGPVAALVLQGIEQCDCRPKDQQNRPIHRLADQAVDQGAGQEQQVGGLQHPHGSAITAPS